MSRRALIRTAAGAMALALAVGPGSTGPAAADKAGDRADDHAYTDYRTDTYLSPEQKHLLDRLAERSTTRLAAESWAHGGTVDRLELTTPSGLPTDRPLADHALAFLRANGPLWNLPVSAPLDVLDVVAAGDCSTVTLTLSVNARPVFNATVTVVLTPGGTIRGVAGRLSGSPAGPLVPTRTTAEQAIAAARTYIGKQTGEPADDVVLPQPTEVVIDPYFLTDGAHQPGAGWLFSARPGGTGQAAVMLVSGQTGAVTVRGTGIALPNRTVAGCPGSNPTKVLPPVILDPMTGTPALVQFGDEGVPTVGATATERAYHLMSQPFMTGMYGDGDPRRHLRDPEEVPGVDGRTTVRFTEYYAGLPVEGARVSVSLLPGGNADLVTARFVYFPHARTTAGVAESAARAAATTRYGELECGTDSACLATVTAEAAATPPAMSLVILSSEIFKGTRIPSFPPDQERLSYKIEFLRRVMYWDATDNVELFGYPTVLAAAPYTIRNGEEGDRVEIVDGVPVPGITPHQDSIRLKNWLDAIDAFYVGLGRIGGMDGVGGRVDARVRQPIDNSLYCYAVVLPHCPAIGLMFGVDFLAEDIVAHEFVHGVVEASGGFARTGEAGSLGEHYPDVMASLIFPGNDPHRWLLGEDSTYGAVRDMAIPSRYGHLGHYGQITEPCDDDEALVCVYSWLGIPNRAAVYIADGGVPGSSHPGVGRATLARIYHATLTSGIHGSSDMFLHLRLNLVATCTALAGRGTVVDARPLVPEDCDHIGRAFDAVGVMAIGEVGWTRFSTDPNTSTPNAVSIREGLRLFNGCTIDNQNLHGVDESGETRDSDIADGLRINFAGEWGADVTSRASSNDPTNREVAYSIWSTWRHTGLVDVTEVYRKPAGVIDEDCRRPNTSVTRRTLYSQQRVSHWSTFLDGGSGDDPINANLALPAGCVVASVRGLHYHTWGVPEGAPAAWLNHNGSHGFNVRRTTRHPQGIGALVHWWYEPTESIKVRAIYEVFQPVGTDCRVGGLQDTP